MRMHGISHVLVLAARPFAHPCFPALLPLPFFCCVVFGQSFRSGVSVGGNRHSAVWFAALVFPSHAFLTDWTGGMNDAVRRIPRPEEGSRLQTRMEAHNLPVLVGTLLSGFTLVRNLRGDGPW